MCVYIMSLNGLYICFLPFFLTDILLPGTTTTTSSGTPQPNKIASGQKILVIKTPKGVYIRTNDGKMFAVRSKAGNGDGDGTTGTASTSTVSSGVNTTTTVTAATTGLLVSMQPFCAFL